MGHGQLCITPYEDEEEEMAMAQAVSYVFGGCGQAIEAWSDGKPYFIDDDGSKRYTYLPD